MSRLEIFVLGSFRATLNGESVTQFEADTARALLAYLALHAPAPCRRETLASLLWPDQPEAAARHNLRQALSRLRKAIGDREADPPFLLITRKTIQLGPEGDYWLDVAAFDDLIATCRGHRHRRLEACRSCVQRLREAAALYRGDLMAGFSLNSAPFETWLVTERERRHRQVLHALRHLAAYHERRAEYEQVQRYARQQLALEPWREDAHRLAILLAAAWVEMLTPAEIAAQIEGQTSGLGIDVLETDLRDVPERHRSIRAVFDHSWELLTEREQEVYQALSVFRGGFTREAAHQVTDATLRELMSLAHKSLLHCVPTERFKMHELLRQYAAEKLAQDPGAREEARERHCAYYTAALQGWAADLKGPQQQATLAEMDAESENARAAWDWMAEERQIGRLDRAIDGLCLFYDWRGRYLEGETACRTAATRLGSRASGDELASAPPPTPSVTGGMDAGILPDQVSARILAWQGAFCHRLGRKEAAGQLLHQATVLLRQPERANAGDARRGEAFVLLHMGRLMADTDRREARRLCERGLALYRAWGDRWEAANALSALGRAAGSLGAYGEAERALEESLAIRRALGDRRGIGDALQGLADVAERQGRFEQAERLARKTIALHREIGDRAGVATGLHELGGISLYLGKYVQARSSLEESPAIYENLGTRSMVAHTNMLLGHIRMALGQYERAHTRGQAALALSRKIDFRRGIGTSLLLLCCVALAKGRYAEARRQLKESVAIYREIGHRHDLSAALAFLGYAARGLGDLEEARQRLYESLRLAAEIGAFIPRMIALPAMALLLADRGETERAVSLYALASRHPFVARSRWFEDVARRHIAVAAAILPPDVVAAAQERGRARDLDATIGELLDENVEQFHS